MQPRLEKEAILDDSAYCCPHRQHEIKPSMSMAGCKQVICRAGTATHAELRAQQCEYGCLLLQGFLALTSMTVCAGRASAAANRPAAAIKPAGLLGVGKLTDGVLLPDCGFLTTAAACCACLSVAGACVCAAAAAAMPLAVSVQLGLPVAECLPPLAVLPLSAARPPLAALPWPLPAAAAAAFLTLPDAACDVVPPGLLLLPLTAALLLPLAPPPNAAAAAAVLAATAADFPAALPPASAAAAGRGGLRGGAARLVPAVVVPAAGAELLTAAWLREGLLPVATLQAPPLSLAPPAAADGAVAADVMSAALARFGGLPSEQSLSKSNGDLLALCTAASTTGASSSVCTTPVVGCATAGACTIQDSMRCQQIQQAKSCMHDQRDILKNLKLPYL